MRRRLIAALCLLVALAACAGPTPYQPADARGLNGHEARRIAADRWRVSFAGDTTTPRATVEDYALFRAAEIARREGAARFVVVARETEPVTGFRSAGFGLGVGFPARRSGVFIGGTFPDDATPVTRYTAILEMRLPGPAESLAPGAEVFEAEAVIAAIAPRVRREGG